ncbi:hypothetical protein D3C81_1950690 [compost metagenome]
MPAAYARHKNRSRNRISTADSAHNSTIASSVKAEPSAASTRDAPSPAASPQTTNLQTTRPI